jgi:hypothetical protein
MDLEKVNLRYEGSQIYSEWISSESCHIEVLRIKNCIESMLIFRAFIRNIKASRLFDSMEMVIWIL